MFKHVAIRLTSPLCGCRGQNISWGIQKETKGKAGLLLSCKTCGTQLSVPHKYFRARFEFVIPYPDPTKGEDNEKDKLTVLDGGKILNFPKEGSEDGNDEDVS